MAGVSSQQKGKRGEREICDFFNDIYAELYSELGLELPEKPICQRNQNQSAVGGCDVTSTCNYAVEVKRQEALNINIWWKQCVVSARELNKFPVLMFKQSRQKWRVIMLMNPVVQTNSEWQWYEVKESIRAEVSLEDFRMIFKAHAQAWLIERGSITQ